MTRGLPRTHILVSTAMAVPTPSAGVLDLSKARTKPPEPLRRGRVLQTHRTLWVQDMRHAKREPRHDHAPDDDDVWAWIVIGLIAAGTMLAVWLPLLRGLRA